ncbi:cupin domain-containing protein [Rhizorhapis suberifaciens]|uniref:Quercetin dioxygenase-like cupin family protein n=1 Tax=Rhizorhapis suberifaciens TaxID=13656 RepID=A0A840HUK3_9SPHN|nr:cupin domain-containing protein [Rhizorhapis suberifaciens]MBB4641942.1 quercetin dioxygenase-like cupin family protein [Rhizorhapis suberifaciens]
MRRFLVLMNSVLALASPAIAQVQSGKEAWGPAPPGLPDGSQATILSGDPGKTGFFVIRAKMPAGYTIPPHWHPTDENVTVITGELMLGMGDKVDPATATTLTAGGFIVAKAKMHHYATTKTGAVVQISGEGPFAINYINPADDPRKQ